jgi:NADPH:quinone reductase-like Zn-dependent oxidoreductase
VNRLTLTASTLRARKPDEKARLARAIEDQIWPLIEAGRFKPLIDRSFPLTQAAAAHAYLEGGTHVGKVMLEG